MSRSESEVQQLVQIEGPAYHCILMRNNVGALKDANGRIVRYGLNNNSPTQNAVSKSSDLIGIKTIVVTQEMVGKTVGILTAIEVKKEGWKYKATKREIAQLNFLEWVKKRGGIAGFVSSVEGFKSIMKSWHL